MDGSFKLFDGYVPYYQFGVPGYTASFDTITFAPGERTKAFILRVPLRNDQWNGSDYMDVIDSMEHRWQGNRHFFIKFFNPVMATLADNPYNQWTVACTATDYSVIYRYPVSAGYDQSVYSQTGSPFLEDITVTDAVTYRPGDVIPITLEFSEPITVNASSYISVNGQTASYAGADADQRRIVVGC